MARRFVWVVVMVAGLAGCKGVPKGQVETVDDAAFMRTAAELNVAEIEKGRVAVQRADDDDVRLYGERIIAHHTSANTRLLQLANRKDITLPTNPPLAQRMVLDRLRARSGADFDRAYVEEVIKQHQTAIDLYERQVRNGRDGDVVAYARQTLPALREHLQLAQQLAVELGVKTR